LLKDVTDAGIGSIDTDKHPSKQYTTAIDIWKKG
jgi:hypothetical protein